MADDRFIKDFSKAHKDGLDKISKEIEKARSGIEAQNKALVKSAKEFGKEMQSTGSELSSRLKILIRQNQDEISNIISSSADKQVKTSLKSLEKAYSSYIKSIGTKGEAQWKSHFENLAASAEFTGKQSLIESVEYYKASIDASKKHNEIIKESNKAISLLESMTKHAVGSESFIELQTQLSGSKDILSQLMREFNMSEESINDAISRITGLSGGYEHLTDNIKSSISGMSNLKTELEDAKSIEEIISVLERSGPLSEKINSTLEEMQSKYGKALVNQDAEANLKKYAGLFSDIDKGLGKIDSKGSKIPIIGGIISSKFRAITDSITDAMKDTLKNGGTLTDALSVGMDKLAISWKALAGAAALAAFASFLVLSYEKWTEIQKSVQKVLDSTGVLGDDIGRVTTQIVSANINLSKFGVTTEVAGTAWESLYNQLKSAERISQTLVDTTSLMIVSLRMSAEEAATIVTNFRAIAGASDETVSNMIQNVTAASALAGVSPKKVFSDMAQSSKFIHTYFRGSVSEAAKMSIHAQKLGLSMASVASMSEKMLDWDTSITAEMEASVLLGKQLNFQNARNLMWQGKFQEATDEIANQVESIGNFNKLNFIQKKQLAAAAGLEVDELSKLVKAREDYNALSFDDKAKYKLALKSAEDLNKYNKANVLQEQLAQNELTKISNLWNSISTQLGTLILPLVSGFMTVVYGIVYGINFIVSALNSITSLFSRTNESANEFSSTTKTLQASIGNALQSFIIIGAIVGTVLLPTIKMLAIGAWSLAGATWSRLTAEVASSVAMLGKIPILGKMLLMTGALVIEAWNMVAAQWGLNIAMSANPVGAIIIGVIALGAAIWLLVEYWDDVVDAVISVWSSIKSTFVSGMDWLVGLAKEYGQYIIMAMFPISALYFYWDEIKNFFSNALDWIVKKIESVPILGALFKGLTSVAGAVAGTVSEITPFASGGIVTKPTIGLVGEAGPEIIMPLKGNKQSPSNPVINNSEVVKKIEELISVMKTGFGVYIDGNKVGTAIVSNINHPILTGVN